MPTSVPNFNLLASYISFRDKEGVSKFHVGATSPYRTPYAETFSMLQVLGKIIQPAKFQHRISMHHAVEWH